MIHRTLREVSSIKVIFTRFLKDNISYIATYFISFFFVALFYSISTNHAIEVIYPLSLSIFIIIVFLIFKWIRYYSFNCKLDKCSGKEANIIEGYSQEEKKVVEVIENIKESYIKEINKITSDNLKDNKFISQWIHNMKTPVAVIDLVAQGVKRNEITIEEAMESISEENTRLLINLDQVLNLLRLEDFSRDYVPESINLVKLLKETINEKRNQFIYNNIFPKFECKDEGVQVFTDPKWNKVMLEQFISNAIKYSSSKEEKKYVWFNIKKKGDKVILTIKDEGVGIPDYDIKRIFEPFFTGENGRIFKNSSGIGLYICKEISSKLNHSINISSEVCKGTEIEIHYLSKL